MFKPGDDIVYGVNGVCRVESVGSLDMPGAKKDRIYYTLVPYHGGNGKIFTPADNEKVIIRSVISKDEAMDIINNIKDIGTLSLKDDKKRECDYKEAINKCDCRELVKLIKTIYLRRQQRVSAGRRSTSEDEKYLSLAEERLYGEFAVTLGIKKEEVKDYIISRQQETI